ncbi:MAG: hypothetical protein DWQ34_27950 [Planctomycetota bacterium]|nr:MAG: hypothetical protein DWQ29_15310 [Planctomycetota bacterium]REJ86024.1 MAG: hypothetical protein DWQ34_27950 [Planctomycetota bacterium]REK21380.1 MAG: hypothetical protein DWQ41_21340 [Planctomycetota bacterium]REK40109.1 MAG: hypothetical protein DWQ45_00705 [Planctomycetota bacterium]
MKSVKFVAAGLVLLITLLSGSSANAQGRFEAQWLFWHRNADADGPLINGPNGFSDDDSEFGYDSGFRFTGGWSFGEFDVEASFMQIPDWESRENYTLPLPTVFDDPTNAFIAPANNIAVPGSALRNAATLAAFGEDDEIEYLEAGATASTTYTSTFDSFELNLGSNRAKRPYWFSLGWRHMELDEASTTLLTGTFQVRDADDGAFIGDAGNGGNDALSNSALTSAGFTHIAGTSNGFFGYDPGAAAPTITTLGIAYQGQAQNDLDGVQLTLGGRVQPSDFVILEGFGKLGVYHNEASGSVQETVAGLINDNSVYRRTLSNRKTTASFGGALGFRILVPLTDYISFMTGYEGMLLTNIALGPDQHQGVGTNLIGATQYQVVTHGLFVAHGGNAGLQVTW